MVSDASNPSRIVHLRSSGVSVLVLVGGGELPRIIHWGKDLGGLTSEHLRRFATSVDPPEASSAIDVPPPVPVLPALGT